MTKQAKPFYQERKEKLQKHCNAIRNEINDIERAEAEAEGRKIIGKCFRYDNSGGGTDHKRWWLWAKVLKVEDGCIYTQEFQTIPNKQGYELQFAPCRYYYRRMIHGFQPVATADYRRALKQFQKRAAAITA